MTWDSFCKWWSDIFAGFGYWFFDPAAGGGIANFGRIMMAIALILVGHYFIKLLMFIIRRCAGVKKKLNVDITAKSFVISVIGICLHILLAIAVLMVLNINFSSVAAVVSAGTVAIGLALQNLISSFASGIILLYAKYFKAGDYIQIVHADGTCEGHVKAVNLITTTLRTYDGYEVIIPNDKMIKGVITNLTKEANRRVTISFSVDYSTDIEKLKEVIYKVLNADKRVVPSPMPYVHVSSLDQHGITINAKCWCAFEVYWDLKFDLSEKILLALRDKKVKIPYQNIRLINDEQKPTLEK